MLIFFASFAWVIPASIHFAFASSSFSYYIKIFLISKGAVSVRFPHLNKNSDIKEFLNRRGNRVKRYADNFRRLSNINNRI